MLRNGNLEENNTRIINEGEIGSARAPPGIVRNRAILGFFSPGDHQLHKATLCIVRNRNQIPLLPLFCLWRVQAHPPRVATVALMNVIHQKSTKVADEWGLPPGSGFWNRRRHDASK